MRLLFIIDLFGKGDGWLDAKNVFVLFKAVLSALEGEWERQGRRD
jgi:hypothetical protein